MKKIKSSDFSIIWHVELYSGEFGQDFLDSADFNSKKDAVEFLNNSLCFLSSVKSYSIVPVGGLSSW